MRYYVDACYGWVRFSEIVSQSDLEESNDDLKSFEKLRLKWDGQEWFPRIAIPKNDTPSLTTVTQPPR
ncbi:MAG: hypothetical protein VCA36_10620 [Opitutales bacterium]